METFFLILFIVLGSCLIYLVAEALFYYGPQMLHSLFGSLATADMRIQAGAAATAAEARREARKQQFKQQLKARLGDRAFSSALDELTLEAMTRKPILRKIISEELPNTIVHCVKIHRLAALAAGAEFIGEIALEPETYALRERMVDLAEIIVEEAEQYPLLIEDSDLMQALIGVRSGILPVCRNCPYLRYKTFSAPLLCPTAEIARIKPEDVQSHDSEEE